ncbi:MAG: hypothetical protein IT233_11090 [Bacteroidia bacterium]|nr:hypothetical protein [Bacteroidia bacterium]
MILAAIPLTLIAMVGALMLLAKAQKESLHDIFKYASYFILTVCVFTLSLVLIHAFDHRKEVKMMQMREHCGPGMSCDGPGERMMMFHPKDKGAGCGPEIKGGACCGEEDIKIEKKIIIVDSVIRK